MANKNTSTLGHEFADQLASEEVIGYANETASLTAVEQAHSLVTSTAADHENAEEALEEVYASVQSLSDEYSVSDLSLAEAAVTHAQLRSTGAELRLKVAQRQVINTDTSVANAVAEILRKAMPDTPIHATFVKALPTPYPHDLPVLVVVQLDRATVDRHGIVSGEVVIRSYRTSAHRMLGREKVENALVTADARVRCSSVQTNDADNLDTMTIHVEAIAPTIPRLTRIDTLRVQTIGSRLVSELLTPTTSAHHAISQNGGVSYTRKLKATSNAQDFSEELDGTRRTLTVDVSVVWQLTDSVNFSPTEQVARSATGLIGRFVPGLGRVISAEVVNEDSKLWFNGDRRAILKPLALEGPNSNPTDASGLGYEMYDQSVIRLVVESFTE